MASESELRAQSIAIRSQARAVDGVTQALPGWIGCTGLVGGVHEPKILAGLEEQRACADSLRDVLDELADALDRRADEIVEYRGRLSAWRADLAEWEQKFTRHLIASATGISILHPGAAPPPPQPPFAEVDPW